MKKRVIRIVIVVTLFVFGTGWFTRTFVAKVRREQRQTAAEKVDKKGVRQAIKDMAARHNAITNWMELLPAHDPKSLIPTHYTIDLENVLMGDAGRAVLFLAWVYDIRKDEHGNLVHMIAYQNYRSLWGGAHPLVFVVMKCTPQHAQELLATPRSDAHHKQVFAIIAQIAKVEKTDSANYGDEGEDEPVLDYVDGLNPHAFRAQGEMLDLVFVGDYDWLDESNELLGFYQSDANETEQ